MKDHEIAAAATDLIRDEDSWIKGNWCTSSEEGKDKFCAEGAVYATMGLYQKVTSKGIDGFERTYWDQQDHTSENSALWSQAQRIMDAMTKEGKEMLESKILGGADAGETMADFGWLDLYDLNDSFCDHGEVIAMMEKTTAKLQESDQ